ncbi:MAG: MBL fold metallo-hydrolase [Patescibacteria group bacterium]
MLSQIKQESKNGLVFCFVGVGSAFAKKNDQTSLIIAKDEKTILVDIGNTIPKVLDSKGINISGFDFYHITHSHGDHTGGMEELLLMSRYVKKQKPKLIITEPYYDILWDKTLRGGCAHNELDLLKFSDLVIPVRPIWKQSRPREIYEINVEGINLEIFRTIHIPGNVDMWERAFWSTGLVVDHRVLFTSDTRFDPLIFQHLGMTTNMEAIFHDCQLYDPGTVHATIDELLTLPTELKSKMYLTHYGDNFDSIENKGKASSFRGFAESWKIYKF